MISPGTLVHGVEHFRVAKVCCTIKIGVVVESYPPTVYDNRLYIIRWQDNIESLEEEKNLKIIST